MSTNRVMNPYDYFPDFNKGRPIHNGQIFVGQVGLDPEVPANQKDVTFLDACDCPVGQILMQPIRTSSGGVPIYNGSPIRLFVEGSYSLKVNDRNGVQVYYSRDVTNGIPITSDQIGTDFDQIPLNTDIVYPAANVTALRALTGITVGQSFYLEGHTNAGLGAGSLLATKAVTSEIDDNGLLFIVDGIVIERIGALSVSFEDFGALEGLESSTSIESAVNSGVPVRTHKRSTPYIISRELVVAPNDIRGQQTLLSFTSVSAERGFVFSTSSGLTFNGFLCSTTGTVDQFVSGGAGSGILLERNVFDHAGCIAAMASNVGGVHFDNISSAIFRKNICKNGWRDQGFDAGNVGGNNLFRSIDITNSGQKSVKFVDNEFDTVWSAAYVSNTNVLHFRRNEVNNTADTAFFDRCTGSVTKVKRFVDNTFVDIGKAAIKTLDTNNNNDLVWGENAIIRGNTIDNWGLYVASECILAGRGFTTSYIRTAVKAKGLKLIDNECTQSTAGDTFTALRLVNIDDVEMRGNTFAPIDVLGNEQIISNWCSNLKSSGDTWTLNGHLLLSFGHEGSFKLSGATVVSSRALEIEQDTLTVTQRFQISDCYVEATEAVPTGNVYGVRVISIPADFVLSLTGNTFKPNITFEDSNTVNSFNLVGLPFAAKQVIDNNIIEFTDQVAMQKMIAGDILNPVYFRGLPGAARLNGLSPIEYKGSTNAAGDVFTLTQT